MQNVKIRCPSCFKTGTLEVNHEIIENCDRGIISINVKENTVCPHSFVVYIDRNLVPRDYFLVDFKVTLPNIDFKQEKKIVKVEDYEDIDIYLITINIHANVLASIFKAIFLKQKILLINDLSIINHHLLKLIDYTFSESFIFDLLILSKKKYKKERKKYKDYLVISNDEVIIDKNKIINPKKMKIEHAIIQKFLSIPDIVSGLIILKNEIFKAYEIAKNAFNHFMELSQNEKKSYSIYELAEYINDYTNKLNVKLQKAYLDFLIEIIVNYFELDISEDAKPEDFLGYL